MAYSTIQNLQCDIIIPDSPTRKVKNKVKLTYSDAVFLEKLKCINLYRKFFLLLNVDILFGALVQVSSFI